MEEKFIPEAQKPIHKSARQQAREFVLQRQRAYQIVFGGPGANEVLEDLAKFCRAEESTFHADPRIHAVLEGRREVWLRIQEHLKTDSETLVQKFTAK